MQLKKSGHLLGRATAQSMPLCMRTKSKGPQQHPLRHRPQCYRLVLFNSNKLRLTTLPPPHVLLMVMLMVMPQRIPSAWIVSRTCSSLQKSLGLSLCSGT